MEPDKSHDDAPAHRDSHKWWRLMYEGAWFPPILRCFRVKSRGLVLEVGKPTAETSTRLTPERRGFTGRDCDKIVQSDK